MADSYGPTFGAYANVTDVISAAAQITVLAEIDKLKALIPDPTAGLQAAHPEFDAFHPRQATQLRAELDALKAAIDAAPTV